MKDFVLFRLSKFNLIKNINNIQEIGKCMSRGKQERPNTKIWKTI